MLIYTQRIGMIYLLVMMSRGLFGVFFNKCYDYFDKNLPYEQSNHKKRIASMDH